MPQISSIHIHLLVAFCLVTTVEADWWDDFSNNLATDLSPLLALFGEQATKQFLSESLSIWDNFIFAMAPLGIVTAVVSAIRVCGGPSLRAFIGRAQEGGGIAEAELCSSTSRDVCELYHNGAIVRVFGRPKIIEVIHDTKQADFSYTVNDQHKLTAPKCGIYFFKDYVEGNLAEAGGWTERGVDDTNNEAKKSKVSCREWFQRWLSRYIPRGIEKASRKAAGPNDINFAPNPNLSFNIGIKKHPFYVYWIAAGIGFLCQASVIVFGALATYYWRYEKNDAPPQVWAFPLMTTGTVLLSCGMFWCAYLVERSTKERVFRRDEPSRTASVYVTQPGNQTIGDQTYDPFAFTDSSDPLKEYVTSWKVPRKPDERHVGVWLATSSTMIGFIFQFIGLRAMHSSVSIIVLGAIIIMSIVRATLRTGRLKENQNLLRNHREDVQGHELDWLAMRMCFGRDQKEKKYKNEEETISWSIIPCPESHTTQNSGPADYEKAPLIHDIKDTVTSGQHATEGPIKFIQMEGERYGTIGIRAFFESEESATSQRITQNTMRSQRALRWAEAQWLRNIQRSASLINPSPLEDGAQRRPQKKPHVAGELLYYRARLAELTSPTNNMKSRSSTAWDDRIIPLREQVRRLQTAIESSASVLYPYLKPEWKQAKSLAWSIDVQVSQHVDSWDTFRRSEQHIDEEHQVHVFLRQLSCDGSQDLTTWEVEQSVFEAILGLWVWSIESTPIAKCIRSTSDTEYRELSTASEVSRARIIAFGKTEDETSMTEREFRYWTKDTPVLMSHKQWEPTFGRHVGANSLWSHQGDSTGSMLREVPPIVPDNGLLRLFGWQGAALPAGHEGPLGLCKTHALVTNSRRSISELCAQDIYQSFISAMAMVLETIEGGTTWGEDDSGFYLTNAVVSKLVESFCKSGLGSREEAYAVIIPSLSRRSKLPLPTSVFPEVYKIAKERRLGSQFKEAEHILKWAWQTGLRALDQNPHDTRLETTLLELAELYRNALRQHHHEELGRKGMRWIEAVSRQPPTDSVTKVAGRYAEFMTQRGGKTTESVSNATDVLQAVVDKDRVRCLVEISRSKNIELQDSNERTILSWAAERGWPEIVNACLEFGSAPDSKDEFERTPLSYAAERGHADVARILLDYSALPTTKDEDWRTPLSYASENDHVPVMTILMSDKRITPETKDLKGRLPLHWAAASGSLGAIEFLGKKKAEINDIDQNNHTPFATAMENQQDEAAHLLVTMGAIWDVTFRGLGALESAIEDGLWSCANEIFKLLNKKSMEKDPRQKIQTTAVLVLGETSSIQVMPPPLALIDSQSTFPIKICELNQDGTCSDATVSTLRMALGNTFDATCWMSQCKGPEIVHQSQIKLRRSGASLNTVKFLFNRLRTDIKILQELVSVAAKNPRDPGPLGLLLKMAGNDIELTDEIINATVIPETICSAEKLETLLDLRGKDIVITPTLLQAAEQNTTRTGKLIELLLRRRPEDFTITERMMIALVGGLSKEYRTLESLLYQRPQDIVMTSSVLEQAAANENGLSMFDLLLPHQQEGVEITQKAFRSAIKASGHDEMYWVVGKILMKPNVRVQFTPDVVKDILKTSGAYNDAIDAEVARGLSLYEAGVGLISVSDVLLALFEYEGKDFRVTDEHLIAAAESQNCDTAIFGMFLKRHAAKVSKETAEKLARMAAEAWNGGEIVTELLNAHNEETRMVERQDIK